MPTQDTNTYDAAGNLVQSVSLARTVTHYCYDALSHPVKTIQNPTVADPCADYTPSGAADQDLIQRTVYDAARNAIATVGAAGRTPRTYYDSLNGVAQTVQYLMGHAVTVTAPPNFTPPTPTRMCPRRARRPTTSPGGCCAPPTRPG